ncbi:MAG: site-specific integrase [Clostridia bacterium]|nr:site-specific integrase [Clostridia bacterium]
MTLNSNLPLFSVLLSRFLTEYLPNQRHLSANTVLTYRDTFKQFVKFLVEEKHLSLRSFTIHQFTRELISEFILWIQQGGCSPATANLRLAAIKSFCEYAQYEALECGEQLHHIMAIKPAKTSIPEVGFLTPEQMASLINLPDVSTASGLRHRVALTTLYDTGARASELCGIKIEHLYLQSDNPYIKLYGKGSKWRNVPISNELANLLNVYKQKRSCSKVNHVASQYLVPNKNNFQMKTDGLQYIIDKYAWKLHEMDSAFPEHVHPHMFRHSKAMHMLAAGVNIVYIRDFLGHANIETTMRYARADQEAKRKAIEKLTPRIIEDVDFPDWNDDNDLLSFLNDLA